MRLVGLVLAQCLLCTSVHAAEWLTVANDRLRRVELDLSSVLQSEAGTKVAWGRIVLSDKQAAIAGYKTVSALNRYDCRTRTFVIAKRVYLSADNNTLHEEKVDSSRPISVKTGTVDERFFNEVCKPPSLEDLHSVAKDVAKKLAASDPHLSSVRPSKAEHQSTKTPMAKASDAQQIEAKSKELEPRDKNASSRVIGKETASNGAAATKKAHTWLVNLPPPPPKEPEPAPTQAVEPKHKSAPKPTPSYMRPAPSSAVVKRVVPTESASAPVSHASNETVHWSYEGEGGPERWGKLNPQYATCANGLRQSPIDIRDGIKVDQELILFDYKASYFRVIDNGHTIQVNYGSGSTITVMGRVYELMQIHFHHPAEERIDGKGFDMVAHLVHRDAEGRLAVVAVLLEQGQPQSVIQTMWNNLPLEKNEEYASRAPIQIADLLPAKRDYYSYMGSLTTPPCTEGVLWLVMKQPMQVSTEQIAIFERFYPNNARPVQAGAGRVIKESR